MTWRPKRPSRDRAGLSGPGVEPRRSAVQPRASGAIPGRPARRARPPLVPRLRDRAGGAGTARLSQRRRGRRDRARPTEAPRGVLGGRGRDGSRAIGAVGASDHRRRRSHVRPTRAPRGRARRSPPEDARTGVRPGATPRARRRPDVAGWPDPRHASDLGSGAPHRGPAVRSGPPPGLNGTVPVPRMAHPESSPVLGTRDLRTFGLSAYDLRTNSALNRGIRAFEPSGPSTARVRRTTTLWGVARRHAPRLRGDGA